MQGPDKGKTFELPDHEPQLVGRSSEALPLTDNTVSRRHAELTPDDGRWFIRDLGSQNGTWVNGVRIAERTQLKLGDQIRVGATLFGFGRGDSDAAASRIRILRGREAGAAVERTLPSNEDSMILSEPEPRQSAIEHLRLIYRVTTLTSRPASRQELIERVLDLVFSEFQPERGFILLGGAEDGEHAAPAAVRFAVPPKSKDDEQIAVSRTILSHALRKGEGVLASNARTDPRFKAGDSVQQLNIRSAICSPIRFRDRTFGAVYIDSSIANYTFTEQQLALMNAIGQHTGLAMANAELLAQKMHAERLAAMGETVASLSHSIKNILQGLRGGADVVEMGIKRGDLKVASGGWGILKRNLDRIISLTMNMLAYSRPRTVDLELTSLPRLIDDCVSLLKDQATAKDVALIVDAEPDMPPVPIDPSQIHQALLNLLTNAVEAVEPAHGVVTVRAHYHASAGDKPPEATIVVIDNGPGIPPEKAARIFEPFFTTKGLRGTGLGLAVTKRIAEQHGGTVTLRPANAGQSGRGAAFTIHLPTTVEVVIDPSQTHHPRFGGGGGSGGGSGGGKPSGESPSDHDA